MAEREIVLEVRELARPLAEPVPIPGACPGDALEVELLAVEADPWSAAGVSVVGPGRGIADALAPIEPLTVCWRLTADGHAEAERLPGVRVPGAPFPALVGLAPAGADPRTGDRVTVGVRQGGAGAVWSFPVATAEDALWVGDLRYAQGEGAVAGAGIEVSGRVRLRVRLLAGAARSVRPALLRGAVAAAAPGRLLCTTGIGPSVREASAEAVEDMLAYLGERGLRRGEGLAICSAAIELRISQMVNEPYVTVSAILPLKTVGR